MGLLLSLFISLHTPIQALEVKEVYTVDDWLSIDVGDTVLLMNDLDFDGVDYRPIPLFSGTLDGQGYTLKNVSINLSESSISNVSLFGQLSGASIRNLNVDRLTIDAPIEMVSVGSIAGRALNSTLENIAITNTELNSGFNAGGLIGTIEPLDPWAEVLEPNEVQINQTSFNGMIKGGFQVGGLIGAVNRSTSVSIRNSFTKGTLDALDSIGLIIGEILSSSVNIKDVYSKMTLINTSDETLLGSFAWIGTRMGDGTETHQLVIEHAYHQTNINDPNLYQNLRAWVGLELDSAETVLNDVYYDRDRLLVDDVGMKTREELLIKETYAHFDFDTIWLIDSSLNDGHPLFQYEVFKVTLHPNNGDETQVSNYTKNSNIILPELIFEGFTLDGWYQDEALTIPFEPTKPYNQDMALYVKWIANPTDEVIIEEPVVQEPTNQEPSPEAPIPVQEVEANNVQSPVIVVNKPLVVTPVIEESSETEDESSTSEIVTEPKDEEIDKPLDPVENMVSKAGSWCWLWLLLILLLIAYIIYRKLKKRKLVDNK